MASLLAHETSMGELDQAGRCVTALTANRNLDEEDEDFHDEEEEDIEDEEE